MEKIAKNIEVPKELEEVLGAVLKLVGSSKQALADGFQVGADLPAIISQCAGDFLTAIDGLNKIGAEYSENAHASDQALALFLADLKAALAKAPVPPVV